MLRSLQTTLLMCTHCPSSTFLRPCPEQVHGPHHRLHGQSLGSLARLGQANTSLSVSEMLLWSSGYPAVEADPSFPQKGVQMSLPIHYGVTQDP